MPPAAFSPRKHPQRSPKATPPVLSSAAALLDGLFEHPAEFWPAIALGFVSPCRLERSRQDAVRMSLRESPAAANISESDQ